MATIARAPGSVWLHPDRLARLGSPSGKSVLLAWVGETPDAGPSIVLDRFDCAGLQQARRPSGRERSLRESRICSAIAQRLLTARHGTPRLPGR